MATTYNAGNRPGGFGGGRGGQGGGYSGGRGDRAENAAAATINLADVAFGDALGATLFSDIAERVARDVSPGPKARLNKPSQLRRFYDEFVLLQQRVRRDDEKFKELEPFIQMLKAKVAYALGRDKVDANYAALLKHVVDGCTNAKTLEQAKFFLEAFMAYYKLHGPNEG